MKNINLNLNLKQVNLTKTLAKIYPKLIVIAVVAVLAWTGYFLTNLLYGNFAGDNTSINAEETQKQIKFNKKTLQSLDTLTKDEGKVDISNVGRPNPFAPTN